MEGTHKLWRAQVRTSAWELGPGPTVDAGFQAPSWSAILEAHARIAPKIHRTPVLTSASLNALTGARLFFKCENFQKTGSFKIRGATNAIFSLTDAQVAHGIVTQSSGNHGAAIACAGAWRGANTWVVMPKNAPAVKFRAVEGYGAQVTLCDPTVTARNEAAARLQSETGAICCIPTTTIASSPGKLRLPRNCWKTLAILMRYLLR